MIDLSEKVKGIKLREYFLTGSSLVRGIEPSDIDIVCLFNSQEDINEFATSLTEDGPKEMYGDSRFLSARVENVNYLCTAEVEFFYRFKAYSGVLERLQLEDKADRVEIAKACLYWEMPNTGGDVA